MAFDAGIHDSTALCCICTPKLFALSVCAFCCVAGWALIGETTKWVPVSNARITSVAYDMSSVTVTAAGVSGEALTVSLVVSLVCCAAVEVWWLMCARPFAAVLLQPRHGHGHGRVVCV